MNSKDDLLDLLTAQIEALGELNEALKDFNEFLEGELEKMEALNE